MYVDKRIVYAVQACCGWIIQLFLPQYHAKNVKIVVNPDYKFLQ